MENRENNVQRLRSFKVRLSIIVAVIFFGLMIISNPGEKSFRRYLREYVKSDSRTTLTPEIPPVEIEFARSNYFLFSSYRVAIDGDMHEYLGIFGTFKKY